MKGAGMSLTIEDLEAIKGIVKGIVSESEESLATTVAQDFARMDERFEHIEGDIIELKNDVAELKTDVAELKSDVTELKIDMREVKWSLAEHKL